VPGAMTRIISPILSSEYRTWFRSLKEEAKLQMFENNVLRRRLKP
jgi:hypothetical protein